MNSNNVFMQVNSLPGVQSYLRVCVCAVHFMLCLLDCIFASLVRNCANLKLVYRFQRQ